MILLKGKNLGERQRELNTKVKEAAAQSVDFNEIKDTAEESDVDKFFKIDLASESHNIEYIVEILKSGDSLYISRALKCSWIFADNFTHVINVDNLHKNVIPFMSNKMKKKLLTAIATQVRNESRAAEFYKYCMNVNLQRNALKFLYFTDETFKLEVLKDRSNLLIFQFGCDKNFIGKSFYLVEDYLEAFYGISKNQVLRELSYLYTVSEEKYLDLLEKHFIVKACYNITDLGLRISKSIMKQHKDRVLKMPSLYARLLSKAPLTKYSTEEDAKNYATAVLPEDAQRFWYENYRLRYKLILDKITSGKFQFVKQIFEAKYREQRFETHSFFFSKLYYKLMTTEEKEIWALGQIASKSEIISNKYYRLYMCVGFEKAMEEIKRLEAITTDNSTRADMMIILIASAKTQRDVEKLLNYYLEKHGDEQKEIKENFLDHVLQNFNVFEFDEDCWAALNEMFYNLEVYSLTDLNSKSEFKIVALIYYIINQKEVPKAIRNLLQLEIDRYAMKWNTHKLTEEQQKTVYQYLLKFYTAEIEKLASEPYVDEVRDRLRTFIRFTLNLLDLFKKTKEDIPTLVNEFIKLDWAEFECHTLICDKTKTKLTEVDLFRDMKKNAKLLVEHLPLIKTNIDSYYIKDMSVVFKKLKTYFSNDIAKEYLNFFDSLLAEDHLCPKVTQTAVHGIFQLGNEQFKVDFMRKYAPKHPEINHSEINKNVLLIQRVICVHACYSRPPIPLKTMFLYIKGDYVKFCSPVFQSYMANLPLPLCLEFVESIFDTTESRSLQKRSIRLAFECFNAQTLNILLLRAWKNPERVWFRMIIYKTLFDKISQVKSGQDILLETLKQLTLTLTPGDDDEVFTFLNCCPLSEYRLPEWFEMSWRVVSQFPPNSKNLTRMKSIMMRWCSKIYIIRKEPIFSIIESFIPTAVPVGPLSNEADALINAKWALTAAYIMTNKEKDFSKTVELVKHIFTTCLSDTNIRERKRASLKTFFYFIGELEKLSYFHEFPVYENANKTMQLVLEMLEEKLPFDDIFIVVWVVRLGIVAREAIRETKMKYGCDNTDKFQIKEIANNLADKLGILFEEFFEKEMFSTFFTNIRDTVLRMIERVVFVTTHEAELSYMKINICLGLTALQLTHTYLLVLELLPENCYLEYEQEFETIAAKLHDQGIQTKMFRSL